MMVTALAQGFEVLGDRRYLDAAVRAAEFLWAHNRRARGELWRVNLDGSASIPATQEDYAYLTEALIALFDAGGQEVWLDRARETADAMLERFWDEAQGGFFMSAKGVDPNLIARPKSSNDGAIPSGNSVAVRALGRLAVRTGEARYRQRCEESLAALAPLVERYPAGYSYLMLAADELLNGEAGPWQVAARGAVTVSARLQAEGPGVGRAVVELRLRPGWHVNANPPLSADLVPTTLDLGQAKGGWKLGAVLYPAAKTVHLGFQAEPLAVYQGQVEVSAAVTWDPKDLEDVPILPLLLRLQACDEKSCQLPQTLTLRVPVATVVGP